MCKMFLLDAGEIEVFAIIEKNPDAMFLTDDACARLVADRMRFEVHGTIGRNCLGKVTVRGKRPSRIIRKWHE